MSRGNGTGRVFSPVQSQLRFQVPVRGCCYQDALHRKHYRWIHAGGHSLHAMRIQIAFLCLGLGEDLQENQIETPRLRQSYVFVLLSLGQVQAAHG